MRPRLKRMWPVTAVAAAAIVALMAVWLLPGERPRPPDGRASLPPVATPDPAVPGEDELASLPGPDADPDRPDRPAPGALMLPLSEPQIEHYVGLGVRRALLLQANESLTAKRDQIENQRYLTLIDYRLHSSRQRMYVIDLTDGSMEVMLVAHGKGSDGDHDGWADSFSNTLGSKMSSVGAFVTGQTYQGRHGLSLRLRGLDATNLAAEERAIVMHGAEYVAEGLPVLGRSWGCPAIETRLAGDLIPKLAGGAFIYIAN